jgi:hypothetical protein
MRVEIIQDKTDLDRITIRRRKLLTKARELALGASLIDLPDSPSRERFYGSEQDTRAQFLVFIVLLGDLAFAHRAWQQRIANQETGSFIEAHQRIGRVVGLGIQPQNMFKLRQKGRINLAQAPGLLQVRLELVFLSTSRTKVYETSSQMPLSTALSARSHKLQRA